VEKFGFDIPSNAQINGIEVIWAKSAWSGSCKYNSVAWRFSLLIFLMLDLDYEIGLMNGSQPVNVTNLCQLSNTPCTFWAAAGNVEYDRQHSKKF
jgi:hypothetical protein